MSPALKRARTAEEEVEQLPIPFAPPGADEDGVSQAAPATAPGGAKLGGFVLPGLKLPGRRRTTKQSTSEAKQPSESDDEEPLQARTVASLKVAAASTLTAKTERFAGDLDSEDE